MTKKNMGLFLVLSTSPVISKILASAVARAEPTVFILFTVGWRNGKVT